MSLCPLPRFGALLASAALLIACTPPVASPSPPPVAEQRLTSTPAQATPSPAPSISGVVLDTSGLPLESSVVRVQGTDHETQTNAAGQFVLTSASIGVPVSVSAWKEGFYCAKVESITPPAQDLTLVLRPVQTNDNPDYAWVPPVGENSCYSCKPAVTQVWLDNDAHGRSAANPRFLTMYLGTDAEANQSPRTRYAVDRDYGRIPLRPDLSRPYYGPGYKLDFPESAGNCAACHTPGAAIGAAYETDPTTVKGVDAFGVHCDFCHKIADVLTDSATGMPLPNMPGVLSLEIRRPFPEDEDRYQLFFGTFDDDNVPQEDTYLPLIEQSAFCAPCHYGVFWDTLVYNSYGEWLESPYSDSSSAGAKTCQECHMLAPTMVEGVPLTNVAEGKGGIERDPLRIHAHTFPGAASQSLLQNAVSLQATARRTSEGLEVEVGVTNDQTGHDVPTDSPLRQILLLVEARDASGKPLAQLNGPQLPAWAGVGDASQGRYAGLSGTAFAKILIETWTEISPTGAYWNPTRVVSDNRLRAMARHESRYVFAAPAGGPLTVHVRLLYRRAFIDLMEQKGWETPDILMEEQTLVVP